MVAGAASAYRPQTEAGDRPAGEDAMDAAVGGSVTLPDARTAGQATPIRT
jgi:hypothetical protein